MRCSHLVSLLSVCAVVLALAPLGYAKDEPPVKSEKRYSADELKEIVGPIALYPDVVVSSVLPASTEPMNVMQASQWIAKQEGEIGGAPENSGWSDAVNALVQYPDVVVWMAANLDWMDQLGWAVDVQQEEVLAAIQAFRKSAKDAGNLKSNEHQQIIENNNIITVQPADPQVVYVQQYNPVYVTQPATTWPSSYRPFWAGFAAGAVGAWAFHSIGWGSHHGGHYSGGGININNSPTYNFNKGGNINSVGGGGKSWGSNGPSNRRAGGAAPRGKNGRPASARQPSWNNKRTSGRTAKGGGRAPSRRSGTGNRPPSRPSTRPSSRPTKAPKAGGKSSRGKSSRNNSSRNNSSRNKAQPQQAQPQQAQPQQAQPGPFRIRRIESFGLQDAQQQLTGPKLRESFAQQRQQSLAQQRWPLPWRRRWPLPRRRRAPPLVSTRNRTRGVGTHHA